MRVLYRPVPFDPRVVDVLRAPGASLAEIVSDTAGRHAHRALASVGTELVPRALWPRIRPRAGATVVIRCVPDAFIGWIIGYLGAFLSTYGQVILQVAYAALSIASALVKPPTPRAFKQVKDSPFFDEQSNEARAYQPVPRLYGKLRYTPPIAARPFTEIVGSDQFVNLLYTFGRGPLILDAASVKLGDTLLSALPAGDAEYEWREGRPTDAPRTICGFSVWEENPNAALCDGIRNPAPTFSTLVRSTQTGVAAEEASIDISFPQGLVNMDAMSNDDRDAVLFEVRFREKAGPGAWQTPTFTRWSQGGLVFVDKDNVPLAPGRFRVSGKFYSSFRRGIAWSFPVATEYDVEVKALDAEIDGGSHNADFFRAEWSALRTIVRADPIQEPDLATLGIRIRVNQSLEGVIDAVSAVVTSELLDWDGVTWAARESSNPGAVLRDVLQGSANEYAVADARLDLAALEEFSEHCTALGIEFNGAFDFETTVAQAASDVASAGRGRFFGLDGLYTVAIDKAKAAIAQAFTPRNSRGFLASKKFEQVPHAVRVRFLNELADYVLDERIVYQDGFNVGNATRIYELDAFGTTHPDLAFRSGRYFLRAAALRPVTYELTAGLDNLRATLGDRCELSHDAALLGLAWGRLRSLVTSGPNVVGLVLDESVTLEAAKSYGLRLRYADGTSRLVSLVTPGADTTTDTVNLAAPLVPPDVPAAGDLYQFGEAGLETRPVIVTEIEPLPNLEAALRFVDYSPGIFTTEGEAVPPYTSGVTRPAPNVRQRPPVPVLLGVRTDQAAPLSSAPIGAFLVLALRAGDTTAARPAVSEFFEVQWAEELGTDSGIGPWTSAPRVSASAGDVWVGPVRQASTYSLRWRAVSAVGEPSDWGGLAGVSLLSASGAPTGLAASARTSPLGQGLQPVLRLTWVAPTSPPGCYAVSYQAGAAGAWIEVARIPANVTAYEFAGLAFGDYTLRVQAFAANGQPSAYATTTFSFTAASVFGTVSITNLQIEGGGTSFAGRHLIAEWRVTDSSGNRPLYRDFCVRVFDPTTNANPALATTLRRLPADFADLNQPGLTVQRFAYTYEDNVEDGGPRKRVGVEVRARDQSGALSAPTYLDASNPVPPALSSFSIGSTVGAFVVRIVPGGATADPDFFRFVAYVSEVNGFDPTAPPGDMRTIESAQPEFVVQGTEGATYYVRCAGRDVFTVGPSGLNILAQQSVLVSSAGVGPNQTITTGTATSGVNGPPHKLIDTTKNFVSAGALVGDFVTITSGAGVAQTRIVQAISTTTNTNDTLQVGAAWEVAADIAGATYAVLRSDLADGVVTQLHVTGGLRAGDIRGGTISAALGLGVGESITLDGVNAFISVEDQQGPPVERVKIGKLGAGASDYGLVIRNAAGDVILEADGLGLEVVGTTNIAQNAVGDAGSAADSTAADPSGSWSDVSGSSITLDAGDAGGKVVAIYSLVVTDLLGTAATLDVRLVIDGVTKQTISNITATDLPIYGLALCGTQTGLSGSVVVKLQAQRQPLIGSVDWGFDGIALAVKR